MMVVAVALAFVLGLLFLAAGVMKLVVPHEEGRARIGWVGDVPSSRYRLIGWLESAGAVGLMFPTMVDTFDWITAIAASGLGLVMLLATALHARRHEWGYLSLTGALAGLCGFIAIVLL